MTTTDVYLHERKAWNWRWPNDNNGWPGAGVKRGKRQRYHGPSKRTLAKRAAKAKRSK